MQGQQNHAGPLLLHLVGKTERVLSGSWARHMAVILWSAPCLLDPQTIQALDDMLHALVMEHRSPDMLILQNFIEVGGCRNQNPTLFFVRMQGKAGGVWQQSSAPLGQRFSSPGMYKHHWRTQSCVVSLKTLWGGHLETTVIRLRSLYCLELGHAGTLAALFMLFLPSLHLNLLSVFSLPCDGDPCSPIGCSSTSWWDVPPAGSKHYQVLLFFFSWLQIVLVLTNFHFLWTNLN